MYDDEAADRVTLSGAAHVDERGIQAMAHHEGRARPRRSGRLIVLTSGTTGVKQYVGAELARFKVPRRVEFLDALPRTSTGKVLRRELAGR